MARALTLADGQLSTTAAVIMDGADAPPGGQINIMFANTGMATATVILTFQRAGGTARRLARAELAENEQFLVSNLLIQPDDDLLAVSDIGEAVDYLITTAAGGSFAMTTISEDGTPRSSISGTQTITNVSALTESPALERLNEEQTSLLRRILRGLELQLGVSIPDPA